MAEPSTQPSERPLQHVEVRHLVTLGAWLVVLVIVFQFFDALRVIALGLLAASSLTAALAPLMKYVASRRWLAGPVVGFVPILLAAGLLLVLILFLREPIADGLRDWPQVRAGLDEQLAKWSTAFGLEEPLSIALIFEQLAGLTGGRGLPEAVSMTSNIVSGTLLALVFVFIGSIYMLIEPRERLVRPILRVLPAARRPQLVGALDDLAPRLRWWILGTLTSMTVVGLGAWLGYTIIGLNFALPLAILMGVAEIVPTLGPVSAFLLTLIFAGTQGWSMVIGVSVVYAIIQTVESYILYPLVMRQAVNIPPVVTVFTIVLWGKLFGMPGLLLAVPLNLLVWTFLDHFVMRQRDPL